MKHIILAILLVLSALCAQGQTTLTSSDDFKLILHGHISTEWGSDDPFINEDSVHFGDFSTTIRPMFKFEVGKKWFGVLEPNLTNIAIENSNWLLQAALGYKITDPVSVAVGRIMTGNIYYTPAARFNHLVRVPRVPTGVYAWGFQLTDVVNDNFNIMWDVTTNSEESFQDENSFDGLETSFRLNYKFNDNWSLAGNLSCDFINHDVLGGFDAGYKNGPFDVRLVGYAKSDDHPRDTFGTYLITSYLVLPWLEVHGGLDAQHEHGMSETLGLRVFFNESKTIDARLDFIKSEDFGPKKKYGCGWVTHAILRQ